MTGDKFRLPEQSGVVTSAKTIASRSVELNGKQIHNSAFCDQTIKQTNSKIINKVFVNTLDVIKVFVNHRVVIKFCTLMQCLGHCRQFTAPY
jgi:hypothetical protein